MYQALFYFQEDAVIQAVIKSDRIELNDVGFKYHPDLESEALKKLSLSINKGDFIAVVGRNGSGKSTFARLINALILPTRGIVMVAGMDTGEEKNIWDIRKYAGMVFQNPDNQIVCSIVEDDVAFGPENIGIPAEEIQERVTMALQWVGMQDHAKRSPHQLSGGQKQRVAVAGLLAMSPECIILDEATSMLDPKGRKEIIEVIHRLNKEKNMTVIHITHHMNETAGADKVFIIDQGECILQGTPSEVFSHVELIKEAGLELPQTAQLLYLLEKEGIAVPRGIMEEETAADLVAALL